MKKVLTAFSLVALLCGCSIIPSEVRVVQKQYNELVRPIVRLKGRAELPDGREATWAGSGVVVYSELSSAGSGFDTYVLTCNHCVEVPVFDDSKTESFFPAVKGFKYEVDYIQIFNPDNSSRKVMGFVVGQTNNNVFEMNEDGDIVVVTDPACKDPETGQGAGDDLALIRLNTTERIPAVKMMPREKINDLRLFYKARVVGCSLGGRPYHTFGEITVLENGYMSVNAQFVPGNSGGACYLDETHEFIGITNAGPNPVWHMGLIRPLSRIYDWFDKINHSFIYDKTVSEETKFAVISGDKDKEAFALRTERRALQSELRKIRSQLETLSQSVKTDVEQVKMTIEQHKKAIEELINASIQCDDLAPIIETIETLKNTIESLSKETRMSRV